jgi:hypothetical protein
MLRPGLSKVSAIKAIEELKAKKFITTDKRQKAGVTRYLMLVPALLRY